jgi:hypothetical protein
MASPDRRLLALVALALLAAAPPPILEAGDTATPAQRTAALAATRSFFEAQDEGRYTRAYAMIGPSMTSYLTPALFADNARQLASQAGKLDGRVITRLSWYRDPPDAAAPGLYVAADFTARYANLELMCGYLMWHEASPGRFELVREEQNYIDRAAARAMPPEQRKGLPKLFGCVGAEEGNTVVR